MRARWMALSIAGCAGVLAAATVAIPAGARAGGSPLCRAGQLAGAIIDVQGGAGSRNGRLILVNRGRRACHTKGFIGGQLIGAGGRRLTTHIVRDHGTPARRVVIPSGGAGALTVHWNVVPSGNGPCRTAKWLRVTPPDRTATLRVHFGDTACRGRIDVGPVTNPATV
jgi:Protein of unknown function (DUF4232)